MRKVNGDYKNEGRVQILHYEQSKLGEVEWNYFCGRVARDAYVERQYWRQKAEQSGDGKIRVWSSEVNSRVNVTSTSSDSSSVTYLGQF